MKPAISALISVGILLAPPAVAPSAYSPHFALLQSSGIHAISRWNGSIVIDGSLSDDVYSRLAPITDFKIASRPGAVPAPTKAWVHWNDDGFRFAFDAEDATLVAVPPTADEHSVSSQDRAELFLWPDGSETYYCLELAPRNAVHDYSGRIYRRFDDSWAAEKAVFAAALKPGGYAVEGFVPRSTLLDMGMGSWERGTRFSLGLYRADFSSQEPDNPTWLTWIEPDLPKPDFHVRATFAPVELAE